MNHSFVCRRAYTNYTHYHKVYLSLRETEIDILFMVDIQKKFKYPNYSDNKPIRRTEELECPD